VPAGLAVRMEWSGLSNCCPQYLALCTTVCEAILINQKIWWPEDGDTISRQGLPSKPNNNLYSIYNKHWRKCTQKCEFKWGQIKVYYGNQFDQVRARSICHQQQ